MMVDDLGRIPMSQHLAATLARAASYADAQAHPEVTLEHLLLALVEDPDAAGVLRTTNVDLARLAGEVSIHIGQMEDRRSPDGPGQVIISRDLKRILEAAAAAARQGRRSEINGAIVLAAIIGDGKSTAAHLLRAQGLTFEQAIRALQRVNAPSAPRPDEPHAPPDPAPQPALPGSTDEILASARDRVQTRTGASPPAQSSAPRMPGPESAPVQAGGSAQTPFAPRGEPSFPQAEPQPRAEYPAPRSTAVHEDLAAADARRTHLQPQWQPAAAPPPRAPHPAEISVPQSARTQPPQGWAPPAAQQPAPSMPAPAARPQPPPGPSHPGAQGGQRPGPPPGYGGPPPGAPLPGRPSPLQRPPQAPQAGSGPDPRPAPPSARQRQGGGGSLRVAAGQLVENIPRRMRVGLPMVVEARVARAEVKAIAEGLQGGGAVYRHEVTVTKAMSVRLRAPEGGFFIETSSPETQWIENVLGLMADDFASWRWTVTPRESGKKRLQLLVSARTVGSDGLTAETALPDQVIEVKVGVNYAKTAARWAGWIAAAVIGGILARFGEGLFEPVVSMVRGIGGA